MDSIINIAKLTFNKDEKEALKEYIEGFLDYVEILKDIDIKNEDTESDYNKYFAILREDKVGSSLKRESLLKNAPTEKDGYFLVPNILD